MKNNAIYCDIVTLFNAVSYEPKIKFVKCKFVIIILGNFCH